MGQNENYTNIDLSLVNHTVRPNIKILAQRASASFQRESKFCMQCVIGNYTHFLDKVPLDLKFIENKRCVSNNSTLRVSL